MTRVFATATLAIVFTQCPIGLSAAEIPAAQATGAPGSSVSMPLTLQLDDKEEIAAVQLDIQYDNKVLGVSVVLGDAARSAAKSAYLSDVLPNRKRLIIAGMNQTALPSGELAKLFVSIRPDAKAGSYTLEVSGGLAARGDGRPARLRTNKLTVTVAGEPVVGGSIPAEGVVNAASLKSGPVSAGEMVTIFGAFIGPTEPEGAGSLPDQRILFDDIPAIQTYASTDQVSAIVPMEVRGPNSVMQLSYGPAPARATLQVAASAPGIFTVDSTGSGEAAAVSADGSVVSITSPAQRGDVVALFVTGIGGAPVTARVGGADAEVIAVSNVSPGVGLVQFRIPVEASLSPSASVELTSDGSTTQPGVTIALH